MIGYSYKDKIENFKNNVIEFANTNNKTVMDIPNTFTSEFNSLIFNLTEMARDFYEYVEDRNKKSAKITSIIEGIDEKIIDKYFKLASLNNDKSYQSHQIIKKILIGDAYMKIDKKDIVSMIEKNELSTGETIYIDIVIPVEKTIDIVEIESMLPEEDIKAGLGNYIYEILNKSDTFEQEQTRRSSDSQIVELIDNGLLIPISEDFLLYHKDTEKYGVTSDNKTKQDNLRVRYVLDKISDVESYYTTDKTGDKDKNLYSPLSNRFAIVVNEMEDLKIVSKLSKITGKDDNFGELLHYRDYPYINFKDFKKNGFQIAFDKTKDVIRSISFDASGPHRQQPADYVQTRIGSSEQQLNVVGFLLNMSKTPLSSLKVKNLKLVSGGYNEFVEYVRDIIINGKQEIIAWIFDLEKDAGEIDTYETFGKSEQAEQCKTLCVKLKREIDDIVCKKIIRILDKQKNLSIQKALKIADTVMKLTSIVPEDDPKFIEIKRHIYEKLYEHYEPKYDKNDDIVYGLYGETLKLPDIPAKPRSDILKLLITQIKHHHISQHENDIEITNAICQHVVSWNNIMVQRSSDRLGITSDKFTTMMQEYAQTFIIENEDGEYVCKSCGVILDIKKYISDGTFDKATQRYVTFSIPMTVALEELPEYKKYNVAIRNIDRLISKIAENINILFLVGAKPTQKISRNTLIKDVIDLILVNNVFLTKFKKDRIEKSTRVYGINRDIAATFAFELDNSIFLYTSGKEKDTQKHYKNNNIIAYIIILIILSLDETHVSSMSADKICNYSLYSKFGAKVFNGLKLRVNNLGEVKDISNYPVLCYMIYISTCILSKYPLWYMENEVYKKKVNPLKQLAMVHTIVDLINIILDFAENNRDKHIYDMIYTKFYQKLGTVYSNHHVMDRLQYDSIRSTSQYSDGITPDKIAPNQLNGSYNASKYEPTNYPKYKTPKYFLPPVPTSINDIIPDNTLYCKNGVLHVWDKSFTCSLCGVSLADNKYDDKLTTIARENIINRYLEKIADRYCPTGTIHRYETVEQNGKKIKKCSLCGHEQGVHMSMAQMKNIDVIVTAPKILSFVKKYEQHKEKYDAIADKTLKTLKEQYVESKTHKDDYYKFIEKFIDLIQSTIGDSIKIGDTNINLRDDNYIITHNHLGYPINPPVTVSGKSDLISFKNNHPFFKRDVIIYSNKSIKIDTFYDAHTKILLGYKEFNKEPILNKKTEYRINIEYSMFNKLKYLGSSSKYIDTSKYQDIDIVGLKSRERISNIGNIIYKFLVNINMIKNKYVQKNNDLSHDEQVDNTPIFDVEKYYRKLSGLVTKNDKSKLFKLWYLIVNNVHYQTKYVKNNMSLPKNEIIDMDYIHDRDYSGNLILYYLLSELTKLFEMNNNKYIKQNLSIFVIDFVNVMFKEYNEDYFTRSNEIQRFASELNKSDNVKSSSEMNFSGEEYVTGIYEEFVDPDVEKTKEEKEADFDAKEADEAIDMDGEMDVEEENDRDYAGSEIIKNRYIMKGDYHDIIEELTGKF